MINSVSTKNASDGDRIPIETVFPILTNGRIVIPPGSYVEGTVTEIKRPGRVRGRGELFVRFDSLTLPNGVTRDFRARIGALDGRAAETVDKNEGKIKSEGDKAGDVKTIGEAAGAAAGVGSLAGAVAGHPIMGAGLGAAAGATAGLMYVLPLAARTQSSPRAQPWIWCSTARCNSALRKSISRMRLIRPLKRWAGTGAQRQIAILASLAVLGE